MKVGILTYHRALNYGAFLQAVCLCKRMNAEKDISAEIIDYDMLSARNLYQQLTGNTIKSRLKHFVKTLLGKDSVVVLDISESFQRGYEKAKGLLSEDSLISDDMDAFTAFVKGKYDVIISGSDEIWKIKPIRGFPNPYFLPGDLACRKFSYAVSARMDFNTLPKDQHEKLNGYLKDYEFISVRDELPYSAVKKEGISEEKLMLSCDPSFLYDFPESKITVQEMLKGKCMLDPNKKILVLADVHRKTAESIIRPQCFTTAFRRRNLFTETITAIISLLLSIIHEPTQHLGTLMRKAILHVSPELIRVCTFTVSSNMKTGCVSFIGM